MKLRIFLDYENVFTSSICKKIHVLLFAINSEACSLILKDEIFSQSRFFISDIL